MNGFITGRNVNPKFQLVHPGKLAENQLARSQNLLVTDERTSIEIFTDHVNYFSLDVEGSELGLKIGGRGAGPQPPPL